MNLQSDPLLFFVACSAVFTALLNAYFKLATTFNIIDRPNERSSHTLPVIRGAGVIFIFAILFAEGLTGFEQIPFLAGAGLIGLISFMDDLRSRAASPRAFVHLTAVLLLFYAVGFFKFPLWIIFISTVVTVGAINAFNFMDGINGITGMYAAANLLTLYCVNRYYLSFISESLLVSVLASVLVFLVYNFRKKARCFAGDVGSVTLAYIQVYFVVLLIVTTDKFWWIFIFTVYGIDSVITIVCRLIRKENIFKPHRTHLYQYLANEVGFSHRLVSTIYSCVQLAINVIIVYVFQSGEWVLIPLTVLVVTLIYVAIRYFVTSVFERKPAS